jgi:hypothetical protein
LQVHANCLEMLLLFLRDVADKSSVNKMSIANLSGRRGRGGRGCLCRGGSHVRDGDVRSRASAVVFAPTLFYLRGSKGQQMLKEVEIQVTTASTLKKMLENVEQLWIVRAVVPILPFALDRPHPASRRGMLVCRCPRTCWRKCAL